MNEIVKAEKDLKPQKRCCDNCYFLLIGNICSRDNFKIMDIFDTDCEEYHKIHRWTLDNLKDSFHLSENYVVIKKFKDDLYYCDRLYKTKTGYGRYDEYKRFKKIRLPIFNRGTRYPEKGDIININKQGDIQFIGQTTTKNK